MRPQDNPSAPIGRQPDVLYITPSKPNPWYGQVEPGERFTVQQVDQLKRMGRDPSTVEVIEVRREATDAEVWWPLDSWAPVYAFPCPIIGHRLDRPMVITPSGRAKLVRADGWGQKPSRYPKSARWGSW